MVRKLTAVALSTLMITTSLPAEETERLEIIGADILIPETGRVLTGQRILIEHGRISVIESASGRRQDASTTRLDLTGLTILPGLIDLHSHLLLHPYDETSWNDQVLKESLELRTIRGVIAAKRTLEAGFTTL